MHIECSSATTLKNYRQSVAKAIASIDAFEEENGKKTVIYTEEKSALLQIQCILSQVDKNDQLIHFEFLLPFSLY